MKNVYIPIAWMFTLLGIPFYIMGLIYAMIIESAFDTGCTHGDKLISRVVLILLNDKEKL